MGPKAFNVFLTLYFISLPTSWSLVKIFSLGAGVENLKQILERGYENLCIFSIYKQPGRNKIILGNYSHV
jgi:hypothetical protein